MERRTDKLNWLRKQQGFTLLEMLIAVIILGILAMIIIPQVTTSSDDAKVSAVKADLSAIRSAIEMYYQQHNNKYPGSVTAADATAGSTAVAVDDCKTILIDQLTKFTALNGFATSNRKTLEDAAVAIFGPYVKGGKDSAGTAMTLPVNPFNNLATVKCTAGKDINVTRTADNTVGWQYYPDIGLFFASDTGSSGTPIVAHVNY